MVELYLVTGFLGAGKTTLLKNLMGLLAPKRIRLIINEFGRVGVDGALLADIGAAIDEINNGSIFCVCRLDKFEETLDAALANPPDAVIVEASGLSDPTAIRKVLGSERYADFDYKGAICVVDAKRFHKVFATARVCSKQLSVCDLIVVNKRDLVSDDELESLTGTLRDNFPGAAIRATTLGAIEPGWLETLGRAETPVGAVDDRDLTLQKYTVGIRESMSRYELEHFIKMFVEDTYRVKGFVRLNDGLYLADCVGSLVNISRWPKGAPESTGTLVVLAGKGMNPRGSIKTAIEWYPAHIGNFE